MSLHSESITTVSTKKKQERVLCRSCFDLPAFTATFCGYCLSFWLSGMSLVGRARVTFGRASNAYLCQQLSLAASWCVQVHNLANSTELWASGEHHVASYSNDSSTGLTNSQSLCVQSTECAFPLQAGAAVLQLSIIQSRQAHPCSNQLLALC
jgi:hypothetical protein